MDTCATENFISAQLAQHLGLEHHQRKKNQLLRIAEAPTISCAHFVTVAVSNHCLGYKGSIAFGDQFYSLSFSPSYCPEASLSFPRLCMVFPLDPPHPTILEGRRRLAPPFPLIPPLPPATSSFIFIIVVSRFWGVWWWDVLASTPPHYQRWGFPIVEWGPGVSSMWLQQQGFISTSMLLFYS